MKIYRIHHNEYSYDVYMGHVIVATNEDEVRFLAKSEAGDEGAEIWETAEIEMFGGYSGGEKNPFITLSDFRAG